MPNQIPGFEISAGGKTFTQDEPDGVERIVIEDSLEKIGRAEIVLHSKSGSWQSFTEGTPIEISTAGGDTLFTGFVYAKRLTVKRGLTKMVVTSLGPLIKMKSNFKTQVFEQMKDSDVITQLISDSGLSVGEVTATSKTWDSIVQRTESNLAMARRLCARNGLWLYVKVDKVYAQVPASASAIKVAFDDVIELDSQMSEGTLPTEVTALGWDYVAKAPVTGSFSTTRAFGPGQEIQRTFWKTPQFLPNVFVTDQEVAKSMAEAAFNRHSMTVQQGRLRVKGDGQYRVGTLVEVEGVGDSYTTGGLVVATRHTYMPKTGYETEISFMNGNGWG